MNDSTNKPSELSEHLLERYSRVARRMYHFNQPAEHRFPKIGYGIDTETFQEDIFSLLEWG